MLSDSLVVNVWRAALPAASSQRTAGARGAFGERLGTGARHEGQRDRPVRPPAQTALVVRRCRAARVVADRRRGGLRRFIAGERGGERGGEQARPREGRQQERQHCATARSAQDREDHGAADNRHRRHRPLVRLDRPLLLHKLAQLVGHGRFERESGCGLGHLSETADRRCP